MNTDAMHPCRAGSPDPAAAQVADRGGVRDPALQIAATLVVISPEHDEPREPAILGELFAAGLERYHVRKPDWSREKLGAWLGALPIAWRPRLVLHQHHELVTALGLAGVHFRDERSPLNLSGPARHGGRGHVDRAATSRACHDLATLRNALGRYDAVFFSPVFSSISKPGHGPCGKSSHDEVAALLAHRTTDERRTAVLALGGITAETAPQALALGFDGVAVLGAVWLNADPVRAFLEIKNAIFTATDVRRRDGTRSSLATSAATGLSHA